MTNEQEYAELLRKRGLKATSRRLYLLSLLAKAKSPMSTHELKSAWKKGATDVVTLYRALEALVTVHIVRRVDLRHGHTDYELITPGEHHHHLVCTRCGTIEDFEQCPVDIEQLALKRSTKFASLREHALEFFGTCNTCAA
jgi:Fur family transcriptional regulator, ferric uptake regulator